MDSGINRVNQRAQNMPSANAIPQGGQARPIQPTRPVQQRPSMGQPAQRPNAPMGPRPMPAQPNRPMQPRPGQPMQAGRPMSQMPGQPVRPQPARPAQPNAQGRVFCKKCGKLLAPGEKMCSLCGYKVTE